MKRKGFTLVELLAVIVILAVISIITIPMIGNVIEDSKKKALETSVYGIVESANYFALTNTGVHEFVFDEIKQGETINGKTLDYKGSIDAEGNLYIDNDGNISLCLMNEEYYVYKNYNSGIYIGNRKEDSCKAEYDPLTNKYIAYLESEGTVSNVYSKEEVNTLLDSYALKTDLEPLNTLIEENKTKIADNEEEISTIKENITNIQTNLSTYATKADLETTNGTIQDISDIVGNNTTNITNLQNSVDNLNNNLKDTYYKVITEPISNSAGDLTTTGLHVFRNNQVVVITCAMQATQKGIVNFQLPDGLKPVYTVSGPVQIDGEPYATYATITTDGVVAINIQAINIYHRLNFTFITN